MPLFKSSSEDKCLATLRDLHETRGRLATAILDQETALAQARAVAADDTAMLEAFQKNGSTVAKDERGFPLSAMYSTAPIEQEITRLQGARRALVTKYRAALLELGKVRSAPLWKRAKAVRDQLEAHNQKTAELLRTLEEHAGVKYVMDLLGDRIFFSSKVTAKC